MTSSFTVRTTPRFERLFRKLSRKHPDLIDDYKKSIEILSTDPHNRSRLYKIRKLEGEQRGEGQYRLRLKRWRFRYDIAGQEVILHYCGLRREDTYRR